MIIPPHLTPAERGRFESCVNEIEALARQQGPRIPFAYAFQTTDTSAMIEALRDHFNKARFWNVMAPVPAGQLYFDATKHGMAIMCYPR